MSQTPIDMWETLTTAGIITAQKPAELPSDSPWYVKLLVAFSAWLASLFVLLLIILTGFASSLMDNAYALTITGLALIVAAYTVLRQSDHVFATNFALCISFAGQVLVTLPILDHADKGLHWLLVVLAVFHLLLAIVMPNFIHRVFSSMLAGGYLSYAFGAPYQIFITGIIMVITVWLWLHEFRCPKHMATQRAISYGLTLTVILTTASRLFPETLYFNDGPESIFLWVILSPWLWWVGQALLGAAALYTVWHILDRLGHKLFAPYSIAALLGMLAIVIATMDTEGITVGVLVLLLGFANSNRVLMGLGTVAMLSYISYYYYLLEVSLLDKSQTLLIIGVILLAINFIQQKIAKVTHE
ncbi:uncharacterized protein DUF4401 [Sinobacterium caligoides]|uniref:Uncharacterized protein DUF4401 n=1 Tax=Sinobacterium caligoides TaxID=933926 RepID=A0A3N2D559_9GAMM|nr:DUF4401 domain-containing protein [Sinobacterium caligoides]ROR94910.1 uncharacterized protein DUF4401 [Sinobacterium caligoides]